MASFTVKGINPMLATSDGWSGSRPTDFTAQNMSNLAWAAGTLSLDDSEAPQSPHEPGFLL